MEEVKYELIVERLTYDECRKLHKNRGTNVSEWLGRHGLLPFWLRSTNGGDTYEVGIKRQAILRLHEDDQVDVIFGDDLFNATVTRQLVELLDGWSLQWCGGKRMLVADERSSAWKPSHVYVGHNEGDLFRVPCSTNKLPANGLIGYYDWARQAWFDMMPSVALNKKKQTGSNRRNPILNPLPGDVISLSGSDYIYALRAGTHQFVPYLGDHAIAHLVYTDPSRPALDWDLSNDAVRMLANATDWKRKARYYCELAPRSK